MHLKKTTKKDGRVYLAILQSYRKDGKPRARTIKSLGYVDELSKTYADPIAHFEALAKEMTEQKREKTAPVTITIHPAQKIDKRQEGRRKNIGCAVGLLHYNSLKIEKTIRNQSKGRKFDYDANAIMRLLVVERLLYPGSKRSAFNNKENYFFRSSFLEDDLYRCLDFLAECKNLIIASMNRSIEALKKRDMSAVFYDVTNYHFETDKEDEIRKKGVGKGSKRKAPLIQMGLLQDRNAIPITYKTFAGNTGDCETLLPALKEIKREFKVDRAIVVADKGINCSDNIAACLIDKNGFVFSQSIRGTKSTGELRRWVIADEGYTKNESGTFKSKSRQDIKTIHIKDANGKKRDIDIEVKVVAFWSHKYEVRSRHKRAEVLSKATELIKNLAAYNKATHYGAAKYVKNITFDKKTGEVLEDAGKCAMLDKEAILRAEECDGYYCIITSETHLSDGEIIDIYKGLWRIEESFKITKSDIATRPVYVRNPTHIETHFLTCYIALTILRLIQYDTNFAYSARKIIDELSFMSGTSEEDNWWLFDHRTDVSDELCASVGIDLTKKRMKLEEIKTVLAQVKPK